MEQPQYDSDLSQRDHKSRLEQEETRKKSAIQSDSDQSKSQGMQTRQGTMLENSFTHEKIDDSEEPIGIKNV
jgi:hypothetical protein